MSLSTDKLVVISTTAITLVLIVVDPKNGLELAKYVTAGLIGYLGKDIHRGDE